MSRPEPCPQKPDHSHAVTSATLLDGIRNNDANAWLQLTKIYSPLIGHWCKSAGVSADDTADVTQETLRSVFVAMPNFRRNSPQDSFRGWLRTIVRNKITDYFRGRMNRAQGAGGTDAMHQIAQLPDLAAEESSAEQATSTGFVIQGTLSVIRAEFTETTWQAFWCTTVENRQASIVATELNLSLNAIYTAKSRVLRRIREVLKGLDDNILPGGSGKT